MNHQSSIASCQRCVLLSSSLHFLVLKLSHAAGSWMGLCAVHLPSSQMTADTQSAALHAILHAHETCCGNALQLRQYLQWLHAAGLACKHPSSCLAPQAVGNDTAALRWP